jgi:hypothetical protein
MRRRRRLPDARCNGILKRRAKVRGWEYCSERKEGRGEDREMQMTWGMGRQSWIAMI